MIQKRPIDVILLLLFLSWSVYDIISLLFLDPDYFDLALVRHYGLVAVSYMILIALFAANIASLYGVILRKKWTVKVLYAYFLLNVINTFWVMVFIFKDSAVTKEIFLSGLKSGESAEGIELMVNPIFISIVMVIYAAFYAILSYYVHIKRDYLTGKIIIEPVKENNAGVVGAVPKPPLYCTKCGKEITGGNGFCANCGAGVITSKDIAKAEKKSSILKVLAAFILGFLVVAGVIGGIVGLIKQKKDAESAKIFNDALKGSDTVSPENKKYADYLQKILDYHKSANADLFPLCTKLDNSEVLSYSTFKTEELLKIYISDIDGCIKEYDGYEEKYDLLVKKAIKKNEELVQSENFSEEEKRGEIEGFVATVVDAKKKELALKQAVALQNYNKDALKIYNFLLANFFDYEIDYDEYNELNIYFYSDENIDAYNKLLDEFNVSYNIFIGVKEEINAYTNLRLKKSGTDVKAEDIEEYMQK